MKFRVGVKKCLCRLRVLRKDNKRLVGYNERINCKKVMRFASVDRISNVTAIPEHMVASGTAFQHLCSARVKRKFCPPLISP